MIAAVALKLVQLSLDSQIGTSSAPYVTSEFPKVRGYGAVVRVGAEYRLTPNLELGARAAVALMRVEQPAGALYAEAAWANPELSIEVLHPLLTDDDTELSLSPRLAVGLPLAEHESVQSQLEGRALALANAFEGFGEPELFTPGVLPVTPSVRLRLCDERWRFMATVKVPVLFRVSEASLPPESGTRSVGFLPVLELSARFQPWRWFALGLSPRLSWRALPPWRDHQGTVQPLLGATAEFQLRAAMVVAVVIRAPIAGPLGGSTLAGGLQIGASF